MTRFTLHHDGAQPPQVTPVINVLIVDDNTAYRSLLARLFSREEGFAVVGEAATGEDGIEQARALRPDAILMDFRMPGMDGVSAALSIQHAHSSIRVFILTAQEAVPDMVHALAAGIPVLSKDLPAAAIIAAVLGEVRARDGAGNRGGTHSGQGYE